MSSVMSGISVGEKSFHPVKSLSFDGDSLNKDELIDQMQVKFGELLEAQQNANHFEKLCDTLQQRILNIENESRIEKAELRGEIEKLAFDISTKDEIISDLEKERSKYGEKIREMKTTILELQSKIHEAESSRQILIQDTIDAHKMELDKVLERNSREIASLKNQINELKIENVNQNDNMVKKYSEAENLKQRTTLFEMELRRLESEKIEAEEQANSLRELITKLKEDRKSLLDDIAERDKAIALLRAELTQQKGLNIRHNDDVEELKEQLMQVQELMPEITTFKEFIEELQDRIQMAEKLPLEIKKLKRQLELAHRKLGAAENELDSASSEINLLHDASNTLQNRVDILERENREKTSRLNYLEAKFVNVAAIERANHEFSKNLREVEAALKDEGHSYSLRSIIVVFILIRRWKSLIGTPRYYEKDQRNWWWIANSPSTGYRQGVIFELISDLKLKNEKLTKKVEKLQTLVNDAEQFVEHNENLVNQKEEDISYWKQREEGLRYEVDFLQEKVSNMVDAEKYEKVLEKYTKVKITNKDANDRIEKLVDENSALQHEIKSLHEKQKKDQILLNDKEKLGKIMKTRLSEAEQEVLLLRQALTNKNKEIICLERNKRLTRCALQPKPENVIQEPVGIIEECAVSDSVKRHNEKLKERLERMSKNIG